MAEVIVVGAGPTGLTMAGELARFGVPVRLIESALEASTTSKALGVQARTLEQMAPMGLVDPMLGAGVRLRGANIFSEGRRIAHVTFAGLETRFPFVLAVPQYETERILRENAERRGVRLERGVTLSSLHDEGDGVSAQLHHADGSEESVRAGWLIGCDGAHSTVRHELALPFEGDALEASFALADVKVAWQMADDEIVVYLHHGEIAAFFPLPGGRYRIIIECPTPSGVEGEPTLQEVSDAVARCGAQGLSLSDPVWLARFRINERRVRAYGRGRVFVAGDAAHIHSPVGGQGMNTGIQDACNLAWKLALAWRGRGSAALLESYRSEREAVGAALLEGTRRATRAVLLRNQVAESVRDWVLHSLSSFEPVQDRMRSTIAELTINYRRSPVVRDDLATGLERLAHAWGARPGDRAPDASAVRAADGARITPLELLGDGRHVLLFFAAGAPAHQADLEAVADLVARSYADVVTADVVCTGHDGWRAPADWGRIEDPDGSFHRAFGAEAPQLVLLRPDGYLGYRVGLRDATRLCAYLVEIFGF